MLLGGQPVHQQVGVVDDEATEDQRPTTCQEQLRRLVVEEQLEEHRGSDSLSHDLKAWAAFVSIHFQSLFIASNIRMLQIVNMNVLCHGIVHTPPPPPHFIPTYPHNSAHNQDQQSSKQPAQGSISSLIVRFTHKPIINYTPRNNYIHVVLQYSARCTAKLRPLSLTPLPAC